MAAAKKASPKSKTGSSQKTTKQKPAKAATAKTSANQSQTNAAFEPFNTFFGMETPMNNGNFQFDKMAEDAANMGQAQMDAAMKSSTTFFKGMEGIMKTYMSMVQDNAEKNAEAVKSMMACKTLNEFSDTQSKITQQSFDDFMSGATKISEMSVKVCSEAFEPINDQMSKTIQKASQKAAA